MHKSKEDEGMNEEELKDVEEGLARKKMPKKKKALIIVAAVLVFILISNTIATKIIYDNIFKRYDKPIYESLITEEWKAAKELTVEEEIQGNKGKIAITKISASFKSEDGTPILGATEKGLIVIAPGLHAGMDNYLVLAAHLAKQGYDVITFDPTGTRKSGGKSCIGYTQEAYDLDAVLDYAEELKDYEKVYVIGHSRGATAACELLDQSNAELSDHEISGIVSVSGFNSAMDAVIGLSSSYIGPVANINYPTLYAYQMTLFDNRALKLEVDKVLNTTDTPVLILQGAKDDTAKADKYSIYHKMDSITTGEKTPYLDEEHGHTDILYDENGVWNENTLRMIDNWMDYLD